MDVEQLGYFIKVAETLNFSRAAEALDIPQPQLSRQIQYLENELGAQLLTRTKHHVTLTDAGKAFLADAQEIVARTNGACAKARRISKGGHPRLRIGYTSCALLDALPVPLRTFSHRHPEITLQPELFPPGAQLEALAAHRLDIGLMPLPVNVSGQLAMDVVREDALVVALPTQHPLASADTLSLTALANTSFVGPRREPPAGELQQFLTVCRRAGFEPVVAQEVDSPEAALALVEAGLGVALVPAVAREIQHREVLFRPLQEKWATVQLGALWRRADQSAIVLDFLQALRQSNALREEAARSSGGRWESRPSEADVPRRQRSLRAGDDQHKPAADEGAAKLF
jgi:DNA-binding transcriptional LysR family regulator